MVSIDFEAHFYTKALFEYLAVRQNYPKFTKEPEPASYCLQFTEGISLYQNQAFIDTLCEVGEQRLQAMDLAGLDVQILSFSSPGIDEFYPDTAMSATFATELNDLLFAVTQKYPKRFKGFAAISPYAASQSVKELERSIQQLGFVGWLAHSNFGEGQYFDDVAYWPLLEAAEALNIPIYIHPTTPLTKDFSRYGFALGGPPLGFQVDVSLCVLRMIYAGVFDAFPKLTVILGHMGEMLPFLMPDRIDWAYANPSISKLPGFIKQRPNIKRTPSQVLLENIYVTTSGRFSKPLLHYVVEVMGEDRILLATDYPYESLKQSMDFILHSNFPATLVDKICYQNAAKLGIT